MNISGENSTKLANVHTIRLEFAPADYTEKYNKEIKAAARNLELPGFRKGHVPAGLVAKRYGEQLLRGTIQEMSEKALSEYIEQNQILTVGGIYPAADEDFQLALNEPAKMAFHVLVVPELNIPSDLKVTALRPVFDEAYWQHFDANLCRNMIPQTVKETPVGENLYLGIKIETPRVRTENKENNAETEQWDLINHFAVAWEDLPENFQTALRGKMQDERVVFPADSYGLLVPFVDLEEVKKELPGLFAQMEKQGFALSVEQMYRYDKLENSTEVLLQRLLSDDRSSNLSKEEILKRIHKQTEEKIQLACQIAAVRSELEKLASEWEFEIPFEWMHNVLMQEGVNMQLLPFYVSHRRQILREEAFTRRLFTNLKEKYKAITSNEELYYKRLSLVADLALCTPSLYMLELYSDAQKVSFVSGREEGDVFAKTVNMIMTRVLLLETLFANAEVTYREENIANFCPLSGLSDIYKLQIKFKQSESEKSEPSFEELMESIRNETPVAEPQAEVEEQKEEK